MAVSDWSTVSSFDTKLDFFPNTEESVLYSGNSTDLGNQLGNYVDTDDNNERVLVTCSQSDVSTFSNGGSAYIFLRTGTSWSLEATLLPATSHANQFFGTSGAISGDGTRVVIGASGEVVSATSNAGAAYIFVRSGTTWTQEARIVNPHLAGSNRFGMSVSIDDIGERIVVGRWNTARAHIYRRDGTTWVAEQVITAAADSFGKRVAISRDGTRVVVRGYASVNDVDNLVCFNRSSTTWTRGAAMDGSNLHTNSNPVGNTLAISYDGSVVITGDPLFSGTHSNGGVAYAHRWNGSTWTRLNLTVLYAPLSVSQSNIGFSVALNADGSRLLVGRRGNVGSYTSGAVAVLKWNDTSYDLEGIITPPAPAVGLGLSVAISSNGNRLVASADSAVGTNNKVFVYV